MYDLGRLATDSADRMAPLVVLGKLGPVRVVPAVSGGGSRIIAFNMTRTVGSSRGDTTARIDTGNQRLSGHDVSIPNH